MSTSAAPPSVLLVEDDARLADLLVELLTDEGYRVDVAGDAQAGLQLGLTGRHDVVVLDRGLPGRDGIEVLRALRRRGVGTPVLVLTARGTLGDRVEGLDAGAEDYLVKPFEIPELLARLRALRRRRFDGAEQLPVAGRRLDLASRTVIGDDGVVELSASECALLAVLAAAPGQVFTRGQLLDAAFGAAGALGTVDTYVHYLRRKLGPDVVRTVRGVGYRLGSR
ncbi:response regulator transcription factor [Rhodococcus zopfii]|uniref:response regulator transcription factor n=1 Tax=unclassified Rhodococcus (in: high G+C Gram-positive bacteria) TaxID=192944 RepID=UPI0018CD2D01|nr:MULTISPECIES: response regulator transcription factor [unclassified Rhodococcus (in: high G+C Gram-positive bacteria)]MBH0123739.1 response regulator transcription factor [Rhodococcus sp. CX]MCK8671164.1 response regulator transcription factor [Rhodococcus sp. HM1]